MEIVYWLAGFAALAAFISAKWGRAALPAVIFTVLALVLFMITPVGHDILGFILQTGEKMAEGKK